MFFKLRFGFVCDSGLDANDIIFCIQKIIIKMSKEDANGLSDKIAQMGNYYVDNVLSNELKEIYAQVQLNCQNFRTNVFIKNVNHLDSNIGIFDKEKKYYKYKEGDIDALLKRVKLSSELIEIYEKKAKDL